MTAEWSTMSEHERALRAVRALLETVGHALLVQDRDEVARLLTQATATINKALEYR